MFSLSVSDKIVNQAGAACIAIHLMLAQKNISDHLHFSPNSRYNEQSNLLQLKVSKEKKVNRCLATFIECVFIYHLCTVFYYIYNRLVKRIYAIGTEPIFEQERLSSGCFRTLRCRLDFC